MHKLKSIFIPNSEFHGQNYPKLGTFVLSTFTPCIYMHVVSSFVAFKILSVPLRVILMFGYTTEPQLYLYYDKRKDIRISRGLRIYFTVYPYLSHTTDILNF